MTIEEIIKIESNRAQIHFLLGQTLKQQAINLSSIQVLILLGMNSEEHYTSGTVPYAGTNPTYNINKLCTMKYLEREASKDDKRVKKVRLTESGHLLVSLVKPWLTQLKLE